jgi:hypothetical protein
MDGTVLSSSDVSAISRLPSREVLYGQLVGLIASPISGLARTLNALIGGLAVGLGGVLAKKEADPAFAVSAPAAVADDAGASADSGDTTGSETADASAGEDAAAQEPAAEEPSGEEPAAEEPSGEEPAAQEPAAEEPSGEEPAAQEPAAEEPLPEEVAAEDPVAQGEPDKDGGDALDTTVTETEAQAAPAAEAEDVTDGAAPEAPSGDDETEDQ